MFDWSESHIRRKGAEWLRVSFCLWRSCLFTAQSIIRNIYIRQKIPPRSKKHQKEYWREKGLARITGKETNNFKMSAATRDYVITTALALGLTVLILPKSEKFSRLMHLSCPPVESFRESLNSWIFSLLELDHEGVMHNATTRSFALYAKRLIISPNWFPRARIIDIVERREKPERESGMATTGYGRVV